MSYTTFLLGAVGISLSGVMAPGPITAVTIGKAARSPHAGSLIAMGHGVVELPLMLAVWCGTSWLQHNVYVKAGIGLIGGVLLLMMGAGMFGSARPGDAPAGKLAASAFAAGILLTAANPYFLLWWMTVGAELVIKAVGFGLLGFAVFAVAHWLCDLVWLWFLSHLAYKGGQFFGGRFQKAVFVVCGTFLLLVGGKFIADAVGAMKG